MKRKLSFLFLYLFVFQNIGSQYHLLDFVHNFSIEYHLHNRKYNDNISQFISKHYGALKDMHAKDREKEKQEHNNKHKHCIYHLHLDQYFLKTDLSINFHPVIFSKRIFYYRENFTSPYFDSIIDPPDFS